MAKTKILFKVAEIINNDRNKGPVAIKIEEVDFPTGNGDEKTKITEIFFVGQKNIKNSLQ